MIKRKPYYISVILGIALIVGCQDKMPLVIPDTNPPNTQDYEYELLWEIPLRKDSVYDGGIETILKGDELYYTKTKEGLGKFALDDILVCLDKNSGLELWSWYDENNGDFTQPVITENEIFFENNDRYYSLDRYTGEVIFQNTDLDADLRVLKESGISSLISLLEYGNGVTTPKSKIVEISKADGLLDTLIVKGEDDGFNHYFSHPILSLNEDGDRILFYFYYRIIWNPGEFHIDFFKHNLTKDSIEWVQSNFDSSIGGGTKTHPLIVDDKIIVHAERGVYCLDLDTGEIIWKNDYPYTNFAFTNFIINNNILNTVSDEGHMIGIDITTGEELYNNDYGALARGLTYYDGKVFYTSEHIFIVDQATGELLHKIRTKNWLRDDIFWSKIAIDEENEVMFVMDDTFLQAIRIPE